MPLGLASNEGLGLMVSLILKRPDSANGAEGRMPSWLAIEYQQTSGHRRGG